MTCSGPDALSGTRILLTADAVGGVWTYALDLARGLSARGARITLAVLGPAPTEGQRAAAAAMPGLDIVATGLLLDWLASSPDEVLSAGAALAVLARDVRADLLHLNSPALAAAAAFPCPVVAACHSCVKTWWAAVRGTDLPADFAWRADLVGQGYARADALLAPTAAFGRATADAYGLRSPPAVVHNGRSSPCPPAGEGTTMVQTAAGDATLPPLAAGRAESPRIDVRGETGWGAPGVTRGLDPATSPHQARPAAESVLPAASGRRRRGEAGEPEHDCRGPSDEGEGYSRPALPVPESAGRPETIVFTAGRLWDEGKGAATLDRAASGLAVPVVAAGPVDGPNGARIAFRHLAAPGRLSEADVAAHLAARPIFVSPALYEPFGLAVLEAAGAGCPLVLSDIATFRELWDGAALFVPPGDADALRTALAGLAADAPRRAFLGGAARTRSGAYSLDAMVAGTAALYRAVLAAPKAAAETRWSLAS